MDYNSELLKIEQHKSELIEKAKKEGFKLINGELVKSSFVPVIEIYARANTDYEAYGSFMFIKKIIPISIKQLEEIQKLNQTKDDIVDKFVFDGVLSKIDNLNDLYEIFDWGNGLEAENIDRIVEDLEEEYELEDGQNLYLEFYFKSDNMDGYISIYDMSTEDLEVKQTENIDVYFDKYLKVN